MTEFDMVRVYYPKSRTQTTNIPTKTGAAGYWLVIGAGAGGTGILSGSVGISLSKAVSGLPTNGSPVYVRLWTRFAGGWGTTSTNYTYTSAFSP